MNLVSTALILVLGALSQAHAGERHLILIGGGSRPKPALARFVDLAGGPKARILAITWAGEDPEDYFKAFADDLALSTVTSVENSVSTAAMASKKQDFMSQLSSATGIFICGGDQNRITALFKEHPDLRDALQAKYKAGAVFGGTSAGTAVISEVMITGEGDFTVIDGAKVETDRGLGLLKDVITDQHFIVRQRENRLFSLILAHPDLLGVGVDERTALAVEDEKEAENLGEGQVVMVQAGPSERLILDLLKPGQRYDLKKKKRL